MTAVSPLRYPGGKGAMSDLVAGIRKLNRLGKQPLAEPFAGGAGASLKLLVREETPRILINDADPAVHALWWALINRPKAFLRLIKNTPVSMAQWRRQLTVYRSRRAVSRLRRGFAAFYLNRCNRSGIVVNGGPIGGVSQRGKWKLNARFNKKELYARCERIIEFSGRVSVSGDDGLKFIVKLGATSTTFFIDPPYFGKGSTLYLDALDDDYHRQLASTLESMSDAAWILTYDDCPAIRRLYSGWTTIRPFAMRYSASRHGTGREILIVPKWMHLPRRQGSDALIW
jgi:DNA adenine methylase